MNGLTVMQRTLWTLQIMIVITIICALLLAQKKKKVLCMCNGAKIYLLEYYPWVWKCLKDLPCSYEQDTVYEEKFDAYVLWPLAQVLASSLKFNVWWTGFFSQFELNFYCLCSLKNPVQTRKKIQLIFFSIMTWLP